MDLVHELGEIYASDFTPDDNITKEQKHKLEENAVDKLLEDINYDTDFKELWLEYDNCKSKEALFIKQVDKLECIIQASCYGLNSKYIKGEESINLPCLKEIVEEVKKLSKDNKIPLCAKK